MNPRIRKYTVFLNNGDKVTIKADYVEESQKSCCVCFFIEHKKIAFFIMDNICGWIMEEYRNGE